MENDGTRVTATIEALLLRPLLAPLERAAGPMGDLLANAFADALARQAERRDA